MIILLQQVQPQGSKTLVVLGIILLISKFAHWAFAPKSEEDDEA